MSEEFHKFPHTPHLLWLGSGAPREDKILSPAEAASFLEGEVIIEEKVDGANLGLSVGPEGRIRAQNRGNYLNPNHCHAQWKPLWQWLASRESMLTAGLGRHQILFGEWCYARHTVPYNALPDWFLAFDIFDYQNGRFWSTSRRNALLKSIGICPIPMLASGQFSLQKIKSLLGQSRLGTCQAEGIYLRREYGNSICQRAKVVGMAFRQQIEEHWIRRPLIINCLAHQCSSSTIRTYPA